MLFPILPSHRPLADEFRARPIGRHSAELHRLLLRLRAAPGPRYALVETVPFRAWRVVVLPERLGVPVRFVDERIHDTRVAAEWAIFRLRWRDQAGEELPE